VYNMQEKNTFVQLIRKEMINRGWVNQNGKLINKKLAETSGVNPGTVSRFLNNKSVNMKLDNLYQMLHALDLIRDTSNGSPPTGIEADRKDAATSSADSQSLDRDTREMIDDLLMIVQYGNTDMKNAVRMGIKGVLGAITKESAASEQEVLIQQLQDNYQAIIRRLDLLAGPAGTKSESR